MPTEEVLYSRKLGNVPLAVGKGRVMSLRVNLLYPLKKDKPVKTILTRVVSYKAMVDFLRVIIII